MKISIRVADDLIDVAFKVSTHLLQLGHHSTLVGGSCATLYVPETYQSCDVDIIASFAWNRTTAESAVSDLGFVRQGRIYIHPKSIVTIDFPDDQVLIGDEFIKEFREHRRGPYTLRSLTPTDCVRDRLLIYYTEKPPDISALRAAVQVTKKHDVDVERVRNWSEKLGFGEQFKRFESALD